MYRETNGNFVERIAAAVRHRWDIVESVWGTRHMQVRLADRPGPSRSAARQRLVRWSASFAALVTVALGLPATALAQGQTQAQAVLKVDAVLTTEYGFNDSVVVAATVTADGLIDGEVTATTEFSSTAVVVPVQVAGGAEARVLLVIPMPGFNNGNGTVNVVLTDGNDVVGQEKVVFTHRADVDVTGILPQLKSSMAQVPNRVQLTPEIAALGPAALTQLDTIVGSSSDLASLELPARQAILGWVNAGGRLLLDDDADLTSLPTDWRPGDAGYAIAGLGEVSLSRGKAAAGKWKEILLPAELDVFDSPFGFGTETFADPQASLARRAGVTPPSLSPILIALGIYVVVVGPVLYLVLRAMRRLTLAWLVIPALAALVAGGVVVTGGAWRRGGDPVANVARQSYPGGSSVRSETLLFNRQGGETKVGVPAGWTAAEASAFFGEDPSTAAKRRFVVGDAGSTLATTLEPGQVTVLRANGQTPTESLVVTAKTIGRRKVQGTVTNPSDKPLSAVAVFAAGEVKLVGDVGAGATVPFTLDKVDPAMIGQVTLADQVWVDPAINFGNPFGPGVSTNPGKVDSGGRVVADLGLWSSFSATAGQGMYPAGIVRAAGWRFDQPSELAAGGAVKATELVSAIAPIELGSGTLDRMAVRTLMITSPFDGSANGQQITLLRIPVEATSHKLHPVVPGGSDAELWNGKKWEKIKNEDDPLPAAIVARGSILMRVSMGFNGGPANASAVTLEEVK
jgi:hypothetical protein